MEKIKLTWLLISILLIFFTSGLLIGYMNGSDAEFYRGYNAALEYCKNKPVWGIP